VRKGEVWRVRIPGGGGHVQAGERPAVIVQNNPFIATLPTVFIVPFTSTMRTSRYSGTLIVQPDGRNGLTVPSVALVFQFGAQDKRDFLYPLGMLDSQTLDQILAVLHKLTD
jgi:mRNA-degrading endonuclease toxin of MazEF toxin-antitoxin module